MTIKIKKNGKLDRDTSGKTDGKLSTRETIDILNGGLDY